MSHPRPQHAARHAASALPTSVLAALRSAAWPAHQKLERRLDVKHRFFAPGPYRAHLARMWGYCRGLEDALEPAGLQAVLPDYPARRKSVLLARDLAALGLAAEVVADLPRADLPRRTDPAAALGCLYVLEGATLGGRTLLPVVEARLGYSAEDGAAWLASYGRSVDAMWATFGAAVERWCVTDARRESAVAAAVDTFATLEEWLCREAA